MKVVVLGAGVMGASTALELTQGGADVTLVDPHGPGSGTSSRGAGLVSEAMWHPTSQRLVARSVEILQRVSREGETNGHPFRFHQTGSTTLLPPALVEPARSLAREQARGGAEVRELEPHAAQTLPRHGGMRIDDVALAIHYPRDGWALPRLFAEVTALTARALGAKVLRVPARLADQGTTVVLGDERVRPDAVVVAAGVWTRRALQEAGLDAPLLAYRTQALKFSAARADNVPILHDGVQGFYLRPGIQHLVAGNGTTTTPEDVGHWRAEADPAFVQKTLRRLHHRFPQLPGDAHVEAWAGIEAATPDRGLLAGPHPRAPSVWLLAGGNGHGFMRAPAAGESLAAMILGKKAPVDLAAFAPARFDDLGQDFEIKEGFSLEQPAFK